MCGAICGVSRGKYVKPVPFPKSGIKFVDEDSGRIVHPLKYPCEHPEHWKWGRGTRNGQKLYYSLKEMFYQKWYLTKKELQKQGYEQVTIMQILNWMSEIKRDNRMKKIKD